MMYPPASTSSSPSSSSSRWCPTPEQVMILEELYSRGIKTPSATQIQQITSHLSYHGKVEGKNVFYWFQNHKARERQKLRRKQLSKQPHHGQRVQLQLLNSSGCQLRHCLERSSVALEQQQAPFSTSSSVSGFPDEQGVQKYQRSSKPMMMNDNDKWNTVYGNEVDKVDHQLVTGTHDRNWKAKMDNNDAACPTHHHPIPWCSNTTARPLRTLELFPAKATNVRHESNPSLDQ